MLSPRHPWCSWWLYSCAVPWFPRAWGPCTMTSWQILGSQPQWGSRGSSIPCYGIHLPTPHTYIYIYAFSRRFYPKRLTLHSSYSFTFYQLLLSLGIEPMILALLAPCSTIWATGKPSSVQMPLPSGLPRAQSISVKPPDLMILKIGPYHV